MLTTRQLQQVLAVTQAGSVSGAARALGVSQPALSRSLAALEVQLGVPLFDRTAGAATPTSHGSFLAERAETILHAVASTERELQHWAAGGAGRLRIGVGPITRLRPMRQLLPWLTRNYPRLRLEIRQESGPSLVRGVANGTYDLAFSYSVNADEFDDLQKISLFESPMVNVVAPQHPLARAIRPCAPAELLQFPIATNGLVAMRRWAGELTEREKANLTALVCDDPDAIVAQAGIPPFVGHGPRFLFEEQIARKDLHEVPIVRPYTYQCWMLTSQGMWQTSIIKRIAEYCRSATDTGELPAQSQGSRSP